MKCLPQIFCSSKKWMRHGCTFYSRRRPWRLEESPSSFFQRLLNREFLVYFFGCLWKVHVWRSKSKIAPISTRWISHCTVPMARWWRSPCEHRRKFVLRPHPRVIHYPATTLGLFLGKAPAPGKWVGCPARAGWGRSGAGHARKWVGLAFIITQRLVRYMRVASF